MENEERHVDQVPVLDSWRSFKGTLNSSVWCAKNMAYPKSTSGIVLPNKQIYEFKNQCSSRRAKRLQGENILCFLYITFD